MRCSVSNHLRSLSLENIQISHSVQLCWQSARQILRIPFVIVKKIHKVEYRNKHLSLMMKLRHQYIVEFIGFCEYDLALLTELPLLGQLDNVLTDNPMIPTEYLLNLIDQVAQGMAYLERSRVIHLSLESWQYTADDS